MERDPAYLRTLQRLPEHLRRAYLDGDWDVLSGRYFPEFSRQRHVVEPFPLPTWWRRFRAMDWGYRDPCCVLWVAVSPEGQLVVYRELYVTETLSSQVARKVRELSLGEKIAYTVASPDAWQQRGLPRLREALALQADGQPGLVIFPQCTELLRTLPLLTYDEHDHEDVSDGCEDHAPEALRYAVMSRHPKAVEPERKAPPAYDPFAPPRLQNEGFTSL